MKAKEWREKSEGERDKAIAELSGKVGKLRFDLATREAKNSGDHKKIRKDIARLLTLQREAELAIDTPEDKQ
jgi:large subunit ribosomal protein L29